MEVSITCGYFDRSFYYVSSFIQYLLEFFEVSLTPGAPNKFVGFQNYRELLTDPTFWNSFGITILYVLITVVGSILVGLGVALLMNKEFPGRGIVRALYCFHMLHRLFQLFLHGNMF